MREEKGKNNPRPRSILSLPKHVWHARTHVGSSWSSSSRETAFLLLLLFWGEKAHAVAVDLLLSCMFFFFFFFFFQNACNEKVSWLQKPAESEVAS